MATGRLLLIFRQSRIELTQVFEMIREEYQEEGKSLSSDGAVEVCLAS